VFEGVDSLRITKWYLFGSAYWGLTIGAFGNY
jgi:hypothetical protein